MNVSFGRKYRPLNGTKFAFSQWRFAAGDCPLDSTAQWLLHSLAAAIQTLKVGKLSGAAADDCVH